MQNLRALTRELEHFLERDFVETPRLRDDPRIGSVDAVDVGVDLAFVRLERSGQRNARCIRAAAPQCRDVAVGVDALKARDDDDRASVQVAAHPLPVDFQNTRLRKRAVGQHANLAAGVASRLQSKFGKRDREKPDRDLLAGCGDDVQLAGIRTCRQFVRKRQEPVGLARHRRHDDDQPVPLPMEMRDAARDILDPLGRAHRCATVFLNDQCHRYGPPRLCQSEIARNTSVAFVPPKPNEFDSAARMRILRGFCGTKSSWHCGSC